MLDNIYNCIKYRKGMSMTMVYIIIALAVLVVLLMLIGSWYKDADSILGGLFG
jgi:uncharacterized membrane protein affecting hemolysin expression